MAKTLCEQVEQACRDAIRRIPGIRNVSEREYLEAVEEGLDLILSGITMRMEELIEDDNER